MLDVRKTQESPPADDTAVASAIATLIAPLQSQPGALLPILHAIQDTYGYIPSVAMGVVAKALRQTRAEIHGVVSFYHHFRTQPAGNHVIQVCRAEACQAVGGRELEAHAHQALGIGFHQTTLSEEFTLEPVYCLGNCACGPNIRVGDRIHGRVTPRRFDAVVSALQTHAVEVQ
ncbi:MAG: formate dehydrogenase subunit gamma [Natronospirillum sp.]